MKGLKNLEISEALMLQQKESSILLDRLMDQA